MKNETDSPPKPLTEEEVENWWPPTDNYSYATIPLTDVQYKRVAATIRYLQAENNQLQEALKVFHSEKALADRTTGAGAIDAILTVFDSEAVVNALTITDPKTARADLRILQAENKRLGQGWKNANERIVELNALIKRLREGCHFIASLTDMDKYEGRSSMLVILDKAVELAHASKGGTAQPEVVPLVCACATKTKNEGCDIHPEPKFEAICERCGTALIGTSATSNGTYPDMWWHADGSPDACKPRQPEPKTCPSCGGFYSDHWAFCPDRQKPEPERE